MNDPKDKAQAALDALADAPTPGQTLFDAAGGPLGVITTSLLESDLTPLLTFRRPGSPVLWTTPLAADVGDPPPLDEAVHAAWSRATGSGPRRGRIYRHYKGGLYSVIAVSLAAADLCVLVTYLSNRKETVWTRTLENFSEYVDAGGSKQTLRFAREVT